MLYISDIFGAFGPTDGLGWRREAGRAERDEKKARKVVRGKAEGAGKKNQKKFFFFYFIFMEN